MTLDICRWVTSHMWISHVAHMNESRHTCVARKCKDMAVVEFILPRVIVMNELFRTYERGRFTYINASHHYMNESCRTHERVILMNELFRTYERVHVTCVNASRHLMNKPCRTYERVSHTYAAHKRKDMTVVGDTLSGVGMLNASCCIYAWVYVTYVNESHHTYE